MRFQPYKLQASLVLAFAIAISAFVSPGYAQLPYQTSTFDADGRKVPSPDAYKPYKSIAGFSGPEDLFLTETDEIYVADTKNNRIVHLDREGELLRTLPVGDGEEGQAIKEAQLRAPEGVYVSKLGEIYVADTGNRRIAVFAGDGSYLREYRSPSSQYIPANYLFVPSKIVIDPRGYMYIANKGGYQGMLQLNKEGEFAGFFGANKVSASWIDRLKRRFFTEAQLAEEEKKLPGAIANMAIDERGFIYTINRNLDSGQIKRLNAASYDLLGGANFAPWSNFRNRVNFMDIAVDAEGMITAIEDGTGFINQYDADGQLLFVFGGSGKEDRDGLLQRPTSLIVNSSGDLIIADGDLDLLHWFIPTDYGALVHQAVSHAHKGEYSDALPFWESALEYNGLFGRAYAGIAKAMYANKQYQGALANFKAGKDKEGYSEVFWEIRMDWLQRHFGTGMTLLVAAVATYVLWGQLRKRWRRQRDRQRELELQQQLQQPHQIPQVQRSGAAGQHGGAAEGWLASLRFIVRILAHPLDGMYELTVATRLKFLVALLLPPVTFCVYVAGQAIVSFLFANGDFRELNIPMSAVQLLGLWAVWVLANYLTGSVMMGEGSFKKVFIVNAYALAPVLLFTLPLQLVSNALTLQEQIFYHFGMQVMLGWMGVLMFIGLMTVHNYSMKEALRMGATSIFSLACITLFGLALGGLVMNALDFFTRLGQELVARG